MEVPCYQEISVKNLYEDAMKDELLVKYLPTKEQLSGRLPERDFFFGLMCTLRNQYMKDIIAGAHKARYTVADDDSNNKGISISEAWMAELQKHPYHSSKLWLLIHIEKPGTGIFLMKESAKLHRPHKDSGHQVKPAMKIKTQAGHKKRDRTLAMGNSQRCLHRNKVTHR